MYTQQELNLTCNDINAEWTPGPCTISFEALVARTTDLLRRLDREASLLNNSNAREQHGVSASQR